MTDDAVNILIAGDFIRDRNAFFRRSSIPIRSLISWISSAGTGAHIWVISCGAC